MSRAQYLIDAGLKAEERMPDQIAHAARCKKWYTHQGQLIAGRQSLLPGKPPCMVDEKGANQQDCIDKVARVEHGVPGREKGIVYPSMGVRPAIYKESGYKQEAHYTHQPVIAQAPNRLLYFCPG